MARAAGYSDGLDEGVNRALGISEKEANEIEEFVIECEIHGNTAPQPARQAGQKATSAIPRDRASERWCKPIGGVLAGLGVVGLLMLFANTPDVPNGLPNALNFSVLTAFGAAAYLRRHVALILGWSYFVLLAFMTVMHGFVPMEIFQCIGLIAFLAYLRRRV